MLTFVLNGGHNRRDMTYEDLIETYGGLSKAARALGLAKQTVHRWKGGGIPFEKQFIIQMKTKGRLKARMPELSPRKAA